jgi:hypothetical protein
MVKKPLRNLRCNNTFEGKFFKIVKGTSSEAISMDIDDPVLKNRAANVYYHLMIAREFWVNEIKSDFVKNHKQIVIRVNILHSYSKYRHFKHISHGENYNNAWTIPAGETPESVPDREEWGKEIWFSPMKKVSMKKKYKSKGNNPVHESLTIIKDPLIQTSMNGVIYTGLGLLTAPTIDGSGFLTAILKRAGTIGVLFAFTHLTKKIDHWFIQKYYYVDGAMIPEVIYHEYAHIALSDTMTTTHSVPVIEGMADYFAARISNRKKIYDSIKGLSTNNPKNTKNNSMYHPFLEGWWNAQSDFTLSLLWKGRDKFQDLNDEREEKGLPIMVDYDQLVYSSHFLLTEESVIDEDLTSALVESCKTLCSSKRTGVNTLHQTFEEKGFN